MTPLNDKDYLFNVGSSILDSVGQALACIGIDVPSRKFVGFDRPPQDCCPELVCWIGNIRPWDGDFPDTRTSGRLLVHNAYAFDVTIRIGRCYVDSGENGDPIDEGTLQDWGKLLYQDIRAIYFGWVEQWRAGNVSELQNVELVTVGKCTQYNSGGCAGNEFVITIGTFG